jgi:hypothetical protein
VARSHDPQWFLLKEESMTRRKVLSLLAPFAGLLLAAPAVADPPQRTPIDVTFIDTYLSYLCGADVQVHLRGTVIDTQRDGIDSSRTADYTFTFTNLVTDKTAVLRLSGLRQAAYSEQDGVFTSVFSFSGAGARFFGPDQQAPLVINAGRFVETYTFDSNTGEFAYGGVVHGLAGETLTSEMICEAID